MFGLPFGVLGFREVWLYVFWDLGLGKWGIGASGCRMLGLWWGFGFDIQFFLLRVPVTETPSLHCKVSISRNPHVVP